MPGIRIEMRNIREVLRLRRSRGASVAEIGKACHLSTSTVHEYLCRSEAAGLVWPLPEILSDEDLERALFPPRPSKGEPPRPLPDWKEVHKELSRKGVTLLLIWREYRERHPDGYGYSRFADLYTAWEKTTDLRMLQRHKAGEKLFVDFAGLTGRLTDPQTGELREIQVFVSAMGASQKLFAWGCRAQDQESWLGAHVKAFEFYGSLPQVLVPDNLKAGVTSPCYYEPTLNEAYAELARFYELTVLPARVRKPRDKAKVENGVQQVERWVLAPLRDRTFFSLSEFNEALTQKLEELNARLMKGPGLSRNELFEQIDRPAMRALPETRYTFAQWKGAKVAPDYHVELEGHRYSVPYIHIGKPVRIRSTQHVVEVFAGSQKVASHVRSLRRGGFTTEPVHMPEKHARASWSPERLTRWALIIGPQTSLLVQNMLAAKECVEHGYRSVLGVLSLEKSYGKQRLEAACYRANQVRALSYKSVKSILAKNLDAEPLQPALAALPLHDNVRGENYYAPEAPCAN